jgi:NNP family nitrate/nitrite transporter-like MFS transporter
MIWVMMGPLAPGIAAELWPRPTGVSLDEHLRQTATWKGMLVSIPLLGGSMLRLVLGLMTDRIGARRTGLIGMGLTAVPLLMGWLWANTLGELMLVGLLLGVAGASFAAALPLASRWYPPQCQGLALGIAGAGNSGTALATLFAPLLAASLGWRSVFGVALIPLGLTFVTFLLLAKDPPSQPRPQPLAAYGSVLGRPEAWWFCFFYGITFGGFVGLASFLTTFFRDQYFAADDAAAARGSYLVTACVIAGSFMRPVGGFLADHFGGGRVLVRLYAGVALVLMGVAVLPPALAAATLLAAGMGMLGMGNGAVFQLVPRRFPKEIGVVTGLVGAAGGLGGFFLPNVLGVLKGWTGSYGTGFAVLAAGSLAGAAGLWALGWAGGDEITVEPAPATT